VFGKQEMSSFVVLWSKLDQNGFLIPGSSNRPPRKVKPVTLIIRVNGNEPSTVHTIQLAEELEHGEVLRVRLRWIRSRVREFNTRQSIRKGREVRIQHAERCRTFGYGHGNARDTEHVVLSVGSKKEFDGEQLVRVHGVGEDGC